MWIDEELTETGAKPVYSDRPSGPPNKEQEQNRARAILAQARLREKVARDFDLSSQALSGAYEVPE